MIDSVSYVKKNITYWVIKQLATPPIAYGKRYAVALIILPQLFSYYHKEMLWLNPLKHLSTIIPPL